MLFFFLIEIAILIFTISGIKGRTHMVSKVKEHYNNYAVEEWERLNTPYSRIEFNCTMHMIKKYFPSEGKILDIGAGPGRYSLKLAQMGYNVSLLDISDKEWEIAKQNFEQHDCISDGFHCQSALELDNFKDNEFDSVLIMGPMYHLHDINDRLFVLKQIKRILKKGGTGIVAYINTLGVLKSSIYECPDLFQNHTQRLKEYLEGDLKLSHEDAFTSAYFTRPEQALEEVKSSGLSVVSYGGAESFLSGMHLELAKIKTESEEMYEKYLSMAAECCELPQYRDATEHLNIIVRNS